MKRVQWGRARTLSFRVPDLPIWKQQEPDSPGRDGLGDESEAIDGTGTSSLPLWSAGKQRRALSMESEIGGNCREGLEPERVLVWDERCGPHLSNCGLTIAT